MYTPTNEEIEMMKTNREALCFWPEHLQKWARENRQEFFLLLSSGWMRLRYSERLCGSNTHRLRDDYELPKPERTAESKAVIEWLERTLAELKGEGK